MKNKMPLVPILVISLALLLAIFFLYPKDPVTEQLSKPAHSHEPVGTLKLGMTKAEAETLLGNPQKVSADGTVWNYDALTITFHSFNERVSEIQAQTGSSFALDSNIGLGSTREDVMEAYPLAYEIDGDLDIDKVSSWIYVDGLDDSLQIGVTVGIVSVIIWKDYGNPLLEALTVNKITLYTADSTPVQVIDKAAKRICTTMTISEPEEVPMPVGTPVGWMDFGSGTAVCLYEGDYATVFRYEGTFDPKTTQKLKTHLEGIFFGLNDAFSQALQNPTETW